MKRRELIAGIVALLFAAAWFAPRSTAQDTDADRISALETAVAELTKRVHALEHDQPNSAESESEDSERFTIDGTFQIPYVQRFGGDEGDPCTGTSDYPDIETGSTVTVADGSGNVIGTGRLGEGTQVRLGSGSNSYRCAFPFSLSDLPRSDFYAVGLGRRGEVVYSFEDLEDEDWTVSMELK